MTAGLSSPRFRPVPFMDKSRTSKISPRPRHSKKENQQSETKLDQICKVPEPLVEEEDPPPSTAERKCRSPNHWMILVTRLDPGSDGGKWWQMVAPFLTRNPLRFRRWTSSSVQLQAGQCNCSSALQRLDSSDALSMKHGKSSVLQTKTSWGSI